MSWWVFPFVDGSLASFVWQLHHPLQHQGFLCFCSPRAGQTCARNNSLTWWTLKNFGVGMYQQANTSVRIDHDWGNFGQISPSAARGYQTAISYAKPRLNRQVFCDKILLRSCWNLLRISQRSFCEGLQDPPRHRARGACAKALVACSLSISRQIFCKVFLCLSAYGNLVTLS